jgi:hypothetical protein
MSDDTSITPIILTSPDDLGPEPANAAEIYEALGRFVVAWGSMECHLDMLVRMALNISGSGDYFRVNLGKKLDQFKEICRDTPVLQPYSDVARSMSSTLKVLGRERHMLIHSIAVEYDDGSLVLRHAEHPQGRDLAVTRVALTKAAADQFTAETARIHRLIFDFLRELEPLQGAEKLRRAEELSRSAGNNRAPTQLQASLPPRPSPKAGKAAKRGA